MKKLTVTLCFSLLMLAMANFAVIGQIRIPKIFKPKQNPPTQNPPSPTPTTTNPVNAPEVRQTNNQPSADIQTGGNYIDDGYTWFEALSTEELNAQHRPVTTGWALDSTLRLIGDYPRRSGFKVNVSRAGKILATNRCEAYPADKGSHYGGMNYVVTSACFDKTKTVKEIGKFDVEIIAINGETDAETSVRKYTIEVQKVDRIGGGFSNPQPDAPHYYVSRHAEAPVSFLYLRPKNVDSYIFKDEYPQWNGVELYFNLSPTELGKQIRTPYVQCSVDGKPLALANDKIDIGNDKNTRKYEVVYSDRLAAAYKNGTPFKDDIGFRLVRVILPFFWGNDSHGFLMSDHPGKWECGLMNNGEKWRTWRWTIGRDGMPVKHAEQNGNVNLYLNSYLIDTEIPAGGTVLDKRIAPTSATDGFFYGQPWTSAEGRAMAAKVPTKGNAAPVPSNKIK